MAETGSGIGGPGGGDPAGPGRGRAGVPAGSGVEIARSITALAGGNAGYALLQWLVLLVAARGFGAGAVGDLTLAWSVTAPVFVLGSLQLRLLLVADPLAERRIGSYVRLRSWSALAAVGVSIAAAGVAVREPRAVLVCGLVALSKYVELWADLAGAVFQIRGAFGRLLGSQAARGVLAVAAFSLAAWRGFDVTAGLVLWVALWSCSVAVLDRPALQGVLGPSPTRAPEGQPGFLRATAAAGASLGLAAFLGSLAANLPRIWLGRYGSRLALGEYGVVSYVIAAASVVLGAAVLGLAPSLAGEPDPALRRRRVVRLAVAAAGLAAAASTVASWKAGALVAALVGPGFEGSAGLLRTAVWALPFYAVATVGNTAAAVERRGRQQVAAYAVTLVATGAALALGRAARPADLAAGALVVGSAVQAFSVMAGLRLGRPGPRSAS